MMIRGGGNPHPAMAAMPLREWTRRLGALPVPAEAKADISAEKCAKQQNPTLDAKTQQTPVRHQGAASNTR
jgi:hypothetical protein